MEKLTNKMINTLRKHSIGVTSILVVYDFLTIVNSYFIALWLRFDCKYSAIPANYLEIYFTSIIVYAVISVVIYAIFKLYRSIWRFASYNELIRIFQATVVTFIVQIILTRVIYGRMPNSYLIFGIIIQAFFAVAIRFSYRFVLLLRGRRDDDKPSKNVMIIGAGQNGQIIARDIKHAKETSDVVRCFIDDNTDKVGRYIDGIKVVGTREDILKAVEDYHIDKIYLAMPNASAADRRDILDICKETGCEMKTLPGMYQLVTGEVNVSRMKNVAIEDLLGREPIQVNTREIYDYIEGKTILVTGGGGSIGSELCRQIAAHNPRQLIIFDVYENSTYDIQLELKKKYPNLNLVVLIGSVRDSRRIFQVFEDYHPQVVYHAAAHKHVPLMEDSPCEAVKNNAIGTYKTAYAAMAHGCQRFVLISTDKAVNPTNIMGASKRLCEMIIQSFDYCVKVGRAEDMPQLFTHYMQDELDSEEFKAQVRGARTEFVAVRFGNVLGSNGSVIPIFKRQIEAGGPVTVTHPDIIRYFMTIPEAVGLVLQAGVYAEGGEIFVLDMGEPVKIDTLARNLIKLSGYKPDVDIKVEYTGLRPGEKLYEEKLMAEEGLQKTDNDMIHIGNPVHFDIEEFLSKLEDLMDMAYSNDEAAIRQAVADIIDTYKWKKD